MTGLNNGSLSGLPNLPEINFSDLNPVTIESSIITVYEQLSQSTLYPGDPVRLFLESLAYTLALQNAMIDNAGKQNLLAYAKENHLDHLGALMDTPRLSPKAAGTLIRFSLSEALEWPVLIPEGSRVCTAGGETVFSLNRSATIAPGQVSVDIPATCQTPGTLGNGLVPGQINRMVDVIAYVKEVANISISLLGSNTETDGAYRRRIQLAPERFSVAGPGGAYLYHALAVHQDISACAVWRPKPGFVDVRPVLAGGELPPEDILMAVRERLNDKRIRPLTDTVIVAAPELVLYEINGGWVLHRSNESLAEVVKTKIAEALENYRIWQRSQPGRDINPTRLIALLENAGAKRVELATPTFQKLEPWQMAREGIFNLKFLGIEDD